MEIEKEIENELENELGNGKLGKTRNDPFSL